MFSGDHQGKNHLKWVNSNKYISIKTFSMLSMHIWPDGTFYLYYRHLSQDFSDTLFFKETSH